MSLESDGSSVIYAGRPGANKPDLRFIHYNDVYHVSEGSAEPVGGISRFQSLMNYYRSEQFVGQSDLLTFFSGDVFNPSIESTVSKGKHMVPVLNGIGTDVACVGNHDLDFGVTRFRQLASDCNFPWLIANVLDPDLGEDTPIANCQKTCILTSSNGLKIGVIGLGEREWLGTINTLPPNLIYKSASQTAMALAPGLREQGCDLIVVVSHQREVNDNKLANLLPPGMVDIILGGHDHYYAHSIINGTHVLRSGTDFRQLSYIEAFRKQDGSSGWDFNITRRDVVRSIPEDEQAVALVERLTAVLSAKLDKPVGYSVCSLDARFSTVRQRESNMGNFVCDLMRLHYQADCAMMAGGTVRADAILGPGVIKMKDLLTCFPFEDPVVLVKANGQALMDALENGVSQLPALEGRFLQVSNITYGFKLSKPAGSRVTFARIGDEPIDLEKEYTLATRGYMARGKDGFTSLLVKEEGGEIDELVSEENGIMISTILRQYFLSLKILGKWRGIGVGFRKHWDSIHENLHTEGWLKQPSAQSSPVSKPPGHHSASRSALQQAAGSSYYGRFPQETTSADEEVDSDSDDGEILTAPNLTNYVTLPAQSSADEDYRLQLARRVVRKWMRRAGLSPSLKIDEDEFTPAWTSGISPKLEGRIVVEE